MTPLLTAAEVADRAGRSRRTVRRWIQLGAVPGCVRASPYMFDAETIDRWLAERDAAERPPGVRRPGRPRKGD